MFRSHTQFNILFKPTASVKKRLETLQASAAPLPISNHIEISQPVPNNQKRSRSAKSPVPSQIRDGSTIPKKTTKVPVAPHIDKASLSLNKSMTESPNMFLRKLPHKVLLIAGQLSKVTPPKDKPIKDRL